MAVGILPHALRKTKDLASVAVADIDWPNQTTPAATTLGELSHNDLIVVYPSSAMFYKNYRKLPFKTCLLLAEPQAIHGRYYKLLGLLRRRFYKVITRYATYAKKYDNVIALPVVESWVSEQEANSQHQKTKACSLIASNKADLEGHKLRHQIAQWCQTEANHVELLGRAYQPFDDKIDGLAPYDYSVVIENIQEQDYFSEKLLDAMLCDTLPIYWGCPNISEYFNTQGFIICKTTEEVKKAIANSNNKPTAEQATAMAQNKSVALELSQLNRRIAQQLN